MTGVRISDKGALTELAREGTQIDAHVSSSGFLPFRAQGVWAHTTSSALTGSGGYPARPGLQTISGANALTIDLPAASSVAGAMLAFRVTSNHQHVLSASAETGGTRSIVAKDGVLSGSALTFTAGAVNNSATLYCDGARFHLMAGSGSVTGS